MLSLRVEDKKTNFLTLHLIFFAFLFLNYVYNLSVVDLF